MITALDKKKSILHSVYDFYHVYETHLKKEKTKAKVTNDEIIHNDKFTLLQEIKLEYFLPDSVNIFLIPSNT